MHAQFARPQFEVASVKANAHSGFSPTTLQMAGSRFSATGMPLRPLIMQFYNLRDFQIVGGPDWINTDQWDFEAVAGKGATLRMIDPENFDWATEGSLMVQSLIEDRFQFKFYRETKELPAYELTVAKNGPKIKPSTEPRFGHTPCRKGRNRASIVNVRCFRILAGEAIGPCADRQDQSERLVQHQAPVEYGTEGWR